ncbi:MAG: type III pantothenate kinase [Lachnospiraceae bacterium]|nr:type III pantothenate kinase [Lachnospiraceae bacterium]
MLLAVDVGNTNISLGVFDGEDILGRYRLTTRVIRTSDEYGITIADMMEMNGLHREDITDAVIASVVPAVMHSLTSGIIKYFNVTPLIVEAGVKTGIRIATENPKQIGADRIVDAAGAYGLYGGPVLVLDYGTATTYDLVDDTGAFVAGVTAPGIRMSARALWQDAAKLPEVEIVKPPSILARETVSSMQAGLVYGQIGQTEYVVRRMIEESGYKNVKVVATGGLGGMISGETKCIDVYNPDLTLIGIRMVFEKQDKKNDRHN